MKVWGAWKCAPIGPQSPRHPGPPSPPAHQAPSPRSDTRPPATGPPGRAGRSRSSPRLASGYLMLLNTSVSGEQKHAGGTTMSLQQRRQQWRSQQRQQQRGHPARVAVPQCQQVQVQVQGQPAAAPVRLPTMYVPACHPTAVLSACITQRQAHQAASTGACGRQVRRSWRTAGDAGKHSGGPPPGACTPAAQCSSQPRTQTPDRAPPLQGPPACRMGPWGWGCPAAGRWGGRGRGRVGREGPTARAHRPQRTAHPGYRPVTTSNPSCRGQLPGWHLAGLSHSCPSQPAFPGDTPARAPLPPADHLTSRQPLPPCHLRHTARTLPHSLRHTA